MSLPYYYIMGKSGGGGYVAPVNSIDLNNTDGKATWSTTVNSSTSLVKTLSVWYKPQDTSADYIFMQSNASAGLAGLNCYVVGGVIYLFYANGTSSVPGVGTANYRRFNFTTSFTVGTWYHLIFELSAFNTAKVYINNGTASNMSYFDGSSLDLSASSTSYVGNWKTASLDLYSNCIVNDIWLFNKLLDSTERTTLFNQDGEVTDAVLHMKNSSGTTWTDESGNGLDATLSGSFSIVTDIP